VVQQRVDRCHDISFATSRGEDIGNLSGFLSVAPLQINGQLLESTEAPIATLGVSFISITGWQITAQIKLARVNFVPFSNHCKELPGLSVNSDFVA
jgi:hypothetical protein